MCYICMAVIMPSINSNLTIMDAAKKISQAEFLEYLTSGNSTFTLKSLRTGTHFTYKSMAAEDKPFWYIKFLNGPDNTSNYKDMAIVTIQDGPTGKEPIVQARVGISKESKSFKAFDYVFWRALFNEAPHPEIEIWSAGRCRRCGRKLTVPSSIESQIGPECATKSFTKYF